MRPFFFFFLFSLILITFRNVTGRNLIYETCSSTAHNTPNNVNYKFCKITLLGATPQEQSSVKKLGLFSINQIQKTMQQIMKYMGKLLKKKGLNKMIQNSITACSELYAQTLDDLDDTVDKYKAKDFYEVIQDISAISTAATICEGAFAERGMGSPVSDQNDKMSQLSVIALNLVNLYTRFQ